MAHTFTRLLTHVIFSTAGRAPTIDPAIRNDVHAYFGGIVRELGGTPVAIGGTNDHLHALLQLGSDTNVADVLRVGKTNSSRWIHEKWPERRDFAWQRGYAAFTVSASNADAVVRYIARQEEHHRKVSFEDELLAFLRRHGVAFDPNHMFD
jgi:REP element-mobilizing transposase RayT